LTATQTPTRARYQATAPVRVPRPVPGESRPTGLRLVRPGERTPQARLRRRRLVLAGLATSVCAGLFGVVAEHAVLAQQQFRLANLQTQAATEQAHNQALQLQVARLESPSRIVAEARTKLGMVPPAAITYLVPGHPGATKVKGQPATPPTTSPPPHATTNGSGSGTAAATASGSSNSSSSSSASTTATSAP
jgi:cell division protein FtsL